MSKKLRIKYNQLVISNSDFLIDEDNDNISELIDIVERLRVRGLVILLKWDGERGPDDCGPCTFMVTCNDSIENSIRIDAHSMEAAILNGLIEYQKMHGPF